MKYVLLAALLMTSTGCGIEAAAQQQATPARAVSTPADREVAKREFIEAYQIYRMERETWNDLCRDRDYAMEQIDRILANDTPTAEALRSTIEAKKHFDAEIENVDRKMGKQAPNVERAKSDLDAARARWEAVR